MGLEMATYLPTQEDYWEMPIETSSKLMNVSFSSSFFPSNHLIFEILRFTWVHFACVTT